MKLPNPFILASASPARAVLLTEAGYEFKQEASGVNEPERNEGETLRDYVIRLAAYKNEAVRHRHPKACVLTADTVIKLGHLTLGKPADERSAIEMISHMSGRPHTVYTSVVVSAPGTGARTWSSSDSSRVTFRKLNEEEILDYVQNGNPYDYAGGYAIQEKGKELVERTEGRLDTIIGLPINLVKLGIEFLYPED